MLVGSTFSGAGGLDLGLHRAGCTHAFFAESDPFRRRVLARHWPGVHVYEDVRDVGHRPQRGRERLRLARDRSADAAGPASPIVDLLAGGFPCQDLSVAGRRAGLAGGRSGLFFEFARIADDLVGPGGWVLIENVPGLLSSHDGRDFAVVLATLAELGFHDLAWRVLDARYFGVPQRRRRVFIVARRARGSSARQVLIESEGCGGDLEARGKARAGVAGGVAIRLAATGANGIGVSPDAHTLDSRSDRQAVLAATLKGQRGKGGGGIGPEETLLPDEEGTVRRITPTEAERLQGWVDGWTLPDGSSLADAPSWYHLPPEQRDPAPVDPPPDGPRYAACGDGVVAPVAEWIGRRILAVAAGETLEEAA